MADDQGNVFAAEKIIKERTRKAGGTYKNAHLFIILIWFFSKNILNVRFLSN